MLFFLVQFILCCFSLLSAIISPHAAVDDSTTDHKCRIQFRTAEPTLLSIHGRWNLQNRWRGEPLANSDLPSNDHQLELTCHQPEMVEIRAGSQRFQIWIQPKCKLQIKQSDSKLHFSGDLVTENQQMDQLGFQTITPTVPFEISDWSAFLTQQLKRRDELLELIDSANLENTFRQYCEARIHATCCLQLQMQPLLQAVSPQAVQSRLPENYWLFWEQLPVIKGNTASQSYRYLQAIDAKCEHLAMQELKKQLPENKFTAYQLIHHQIEIQNRLLKAETPQLQQTLLARKLLFAVDQLGDRDTAQLIATWKRDLQNPDTLRFLLDEFQKSRPSYDDLAKNEIQSRNNVGSIETQQPAGPYLITAWGTWCKACAIEKPKLDQRIQNGEIKIPVIYMNFGDTEETWRQQLSTLPETRIDWKPSSIEGEDLIQQSLRLKSFPGYFYVDPQLQQVHRVASPSTEDFVVDLRYFARQTPARQ